MYSEFAVDPTEEPSNNSHGAGTVALKTIYIIVLMVFIWNKTHGI